MWSRAWRFILVVVLLSSGAGAALSGWRTSSQILELDRGEHELSDRVDGLLAALDTIAHQAGSETPRDSSLIDRLRSETESIRPHVRSIEGGRAMQGVITSVTTLHDIEARAQEHVRLGQDLMAADVIASEGQPAEQAAASGLRRLRSAENDAYTSARAGALDSSWTVIGATGVLWIAGLLLLVRKPAPVVREAPTEISVPDTRLSAEDAIPAPSVAAHPDLQAAADVCTAIGRLTRAEDLPPLLQQAAHVLNASGVVVWMAAGDELFAAAAFGYPPHVIQKLGPINRSAINATAAAWRTCTLQAVSGDHGGRGAYAAPMLGPDRCVGVLAVEVGAGQDGDSAARAVTMMFAAQLAAALAGWPAASAAAPEDVPPLDKAVEA